MQERENGKEMDRNEVSEADILGDKLQGKYMTFKLALEEYGLPILKVREIIGLLDITRIPKTDEWIRGVINLRGRVIPIVDLRLKFGMEAVDSTDQTVIIVVQVQSQDQEVTMGIIVDEVLEVLDVEAKQIEPPPSFGTDSLDTEFIQGIGKSEERVIFLLDIDKVLSDNEVKKVQEST